MPSAHRRMPGSPRVRTLLLLFATWAISGCGSGGSGGGSTPALLSSPPDVVVSIDNRDTAVLAAPPINRRLLGSNLQWNDDGDGIIQPTVIAYQPAPLARTLALAPTVLRYPGGTQADAYDWRNGVGADGTRGTCLHVFANAQQTVRFGTMEFLDLCGRTGAAPLITVNLVQGGSPGLSAAWVGFVNGAPPTGSVPVVRDWELGNEPYYENAQHPTWDMDAATFAARYDAHAAAMLAADPRIRLFLPVLGSLVTPYVPPARRTWNADVLAAITQRVDVVAVHNAYLPAFGTTAPAEPTVLLGVLTAATAANADLDRIRADLTARGLAAPFALTEYSAMGTLLGTFPIPRTDALPASLAGACYVVDLLCQLARRSDLDSAQHWSLLGNGAFGSMTSGGAPRPASVAMQAVGEAWRGKRLHSTITGPTADIPAIGLIPAQTGLPLIGALTCVDNGQASTILVNRSPSRNLTVRLEFAAGAIAGGLVQVKTLNDSEPLRPHLDGTTTPAWSQQATSATGGGVTVTVPAHAIVIVMTPIPVSGPG